MRGTGSGPWRAQVPPLTGPHLAPARRPAVPGPDLDAYRAAVADLLTEIPDLTHGGAEEVLTARLAEPAIAAVLAATGQGVTGARETLLLEIARYRPNDRSSARDLTALVRIYLLSRIEIMWWGDEPAYLTDAQVLDGPGLVDLDRLRRQGLLRFRYRRQATSLFGRGLRAAQRRLAPERTPRTAGLRFARTRPEMIALLSQIAHEFALAAPPGTPPLWVTSLARSMEHQHRLRRLGYAAVLPSAHCVGYAADIEMDWYRRFGAHEALATLLLGRQDAGEINVIDEGQAWHVCVAPAALPRLRRAFDLEMGEVPTCAVSP
ncbi:DUF5715 family protein [Micromonospora echinofusca]|uniref:Uncharacterized protein n=1 Tax=Micromonospora echinofusca TaxID=47858 RepID=A0ABS3VY71_MICEH|nr:DUF5715 family protein [Micromonospora echinofusca]MBO4209453.1 hypothetical protein [Micromonospora echinofusca]